MSQRGLAKRNTHAARSGWSALREQSCSQRLYVENAVTRAN